MVRHTLLLSLATALLLLAADLTNACLHPPKGFQGVLAQTAQQAIILHRAGRQQLILKTDFRIDPAAGQELPARIAWVIPLPALPDAYATADSEAFTELQQRWNEIWDYVRLKPPADLTFDGDEEEGSEEERSGIELLPEVRIGTYEIQPIKTRGSAGGVALNAWLVEHGFGAIPQNSLAYYIERDWVWLAVIANLSVDGLAPSRGNLRPLRIAFASEAIVYPLLFNAGQGVFDVGLWVISDRALERVAWWIEPFGFELVGEIDLVARRMALEEQAQLLRKSLQAPGLTAEEVAKREEDLAELEILIAGLALPPTITAIERAARDEAGGWEPIARPHVYRIVGMRINDRNNPLSGWSEDFRIGIVR